MAEYYRARTEAGPLIVIFSVSFPLQAAILTGRRGKSATTLSEIDDSVDRIVAGMEGTPMTDGKSKSLVAYHEVGHAVCGTLTPGHDQVQKVLAFLPLPLVLIP